MANTAVKSQSSKDPYDVGRGLRKRCHRVDQGEWNAKQRKFDPLELLLASNRGRVERLLPIKWERMAASPFGFFRGAVPLMAADLAPLPTTGLLVQICGDAHVRNFGAYAGPDGRLIFDINDFDETLTAPWEWDIKRMSASLVLAGRESKDRDDACKAAVLKFVGTYRKRMRDFAALPFLQLARLEINRPEDAAPIASALRKAQRNTPQQTLEKLTKPEGSGRRVFKDDGKILFHVPKDEVKAVVAALDTYRETLHAEYRQLFSRYEVADVAFKVVGTGSVGTRDYSLYLVGNGAEDPLFLQMKEEPASAYAQYLESRETHTNEGQRVVEGQRRMQSRSDIFLGWTHMDGRDYLVRQLRDHKASVAPEDLKGKGLLDYAEVCAELLAKGHARTGDARVIAGYCGGADKLDHAIASFAFAYADQTAADHQAFLAAIKAGKFEVAKTRRA
jgi:uncharacterized protein (DUF2252 family)